MAFTYKNTSGYKLVIPGVGEVEPDGTITSELVLENQYLQLVTSTPTPPQQQTQQVAEQPKEEVKA